MYLSHVYFFFLFLQYSYEIGTVIISSDDNTEAQRSFMYLAQGHQWESWNLTYVVDSDPTWS